MRADAATCSQGGVGGVNVNDSSWQTFEGFKVSSVSVTRPADTVEACRVLLAKGAS